MKAKSLFKLSLKKRLFKFKPYNNVLMYNVSVQDSNTKIGYSESSKEMKLVINPEGKSFIPI